MSGTRSGVASSSAISSLTHFASRSGQAETRLSTLSRIRLHLDTSAGVQAVAQARSRQTKLVRTGVAVHARADAADVGEAVRPIIAEPVKAKVRAVAVAQPGEPDQRVPTQLDVDDGYGCHGDAQSRPRPALGAVSGTGERH